MRSDSHPPYIGHHHTSSSNNNNNNSSNSQHHLNHTSHHNNNHHHHHHHHHGTSHHTSGDTGHSHLQSVCNSSTTGSNLSTSNNLNNNNNNNGSSPNDEHRPVAIVHGKKNRLALGHDDELSVSTAIKRVCINNDRESSQENSRFSISTLNSNSNTRDSAGGDSSGTECNHEDCDNSLRCNKHSSSAPDLRQGSGDGSIHPHHSSESSPSPSSSSVLTHILHSATNAGPINLLTQHSIVNAFSNSSLGTRQGATSGKQVSTSLFQYTLGAPTSVATKLHEETMTYLNQGQPYEIKLKQLNDTFNSNKSNNLRKFRSVIRVGFHERRLQYMEKELINQWRDQRQERILEIDIPLSYGIGEIVCDPMDINRCSFVWDSNKDAGIFIKVNCISTEFTPKKHGGEKGVPFRLIIETYSYSGSLNNSSQSPLTGGNILHAASSQVKVFKPKGADRKHKTDREKMMRRSDQEKFRASNDTTIFTDCPADQLFSSSSLLTSRTLPVITASQSSTNADGSIVKISHLKRDTTNSSVSVTSGVTGGTSSVTTPNKLISPSEPIDFTGSSRNVLPVNDEKRISSNNSRTRGNGGGGGSSSSVGGGGSNTSSNVSSSPTSSTTSTSVTSNGTDVTLNGTNYSSSFILTGEASSDETMQWLALNRFERFHKTFSNFSGSDILRLSRDDLIMLCGLSDGIRLYNCLNCINIRPRLTIYVNCGNDEDFSAIYLDNLTVSELKSKLRNLLMCSSHTNSPTNGNSTNGHSPSNYNISRIRVAAPQNGIFVSVTDEVVRNISSESMFLVNFDKGKLFSFACFYNLMLFVFVCLY